MTVLDLLVATVTADPEWEDMVPRQTDEVVDPLTCNEWGRKGGSWAKEGEFWKK